MGTGKGGRGHPGGDDWHPFTMTLLYATPGPYTLLVINPDKRTSTTMFATPGTSASNQSLRASS